MNFLVALMLIGVVVVQAQDARAYDVVVESNVEYARYGTRLLHLDVYRPAAEGTPLPGPLPAVVAIRGGGWQIGDKEGFGRIAAYFASKGFVAVSIEYRTSREAIFPAALHDAKAAVRWMRSPDAPERRGGLSFGIDPNRIGAIGGSAGAHLVAMLATTARIGRFEGDGGNAGVPSSIRAAVGMATVTNLVSLKSQARPTVIETVSAFIGVSDPTSDEWDAAARNASPITYVASALPAPMLLIHSDADRTIPYQQSIELRQAYEGVGARVRMITYENAPHSFWNDPAWFVRAMEDASRFFQARL